MWLLAKHLALVLVRLSLALVLVRLGLALALALVRLGLGLALYRCAPSRFAKPITNSNGLENSSALGLKQVHPSHTYTCTKLNAAPHNI